MPSFGTASLAQRATLHPDLQRVLDDAIQYFDFSIIEGYRDQAAQEAAFAKGNTKLHYPNGNHNRSPSTAADCMPYPVDWSDEPKNIERLCVLAGVIIASARRLGIGLRWGGDWNRDDDTRNEGSFRDRDHFELDPTHKYPVSTP